MLLERDDAKIGIWWFRIVQLDFTIPMGSLGFRREFFQMFFSYFDIGKLYGECFYRGSAVSY